MLIKKSKLFILVLFFLSISMITSPALGKVTKITTSKENLITVYSIELKAGNYSDLDDDGFQDDLEIDAVLSHIKGNNHRATKIIMYLVITMPSGEYMIFGWEVTIYVDQDFTFHFEIYDGAIESGWYTAEIYIQMIGFGSYQDYSILEFDPPKAGTNGDPRCELFVF